jgi:ABC-type cobalt transport system substrate-binding protein
VASNAEFLEIRMRYRRMVMNCKQISALEDIFLANFTTFYIGSGVGRDSLVGVATGYELDLQILFPAGTRIFSILHSVQTDFGAHPVSYSIGTGGDFLGGKVA